MFTTKIKFYFVSLFRKNQTMIKELRIGNYVDIYYVSDITGAEKRIFKNAIVDTIDSKFIKHNGSSYAYKENIKPIPITEDWLIKFGFEKKTINGSDTWLFNDCIFEIIKNKLSFSLSLADNTGEIVFEKEVSSVHQLQNIFFALTGEELKLKES